MSPKAGFISDPATDNVYPTIEQGCTKNEGGGGRKGRQMSQETRAHGENSDLKISTLLLPPESFTYAALQ